jgi:putative acetyltransferase
MLERSPDGFEIRHAADSDADGVIALYAACWGEHDGMVLDTVGEMAHLNHVASYYEQAGGAAWVAEREGDAPVAGSVAWRPIGDEHVELQMLYILPDARRQGLASYLVGMVERHVADQGIDVLELWSDIRFTDAHRLYRSLGWQQIDETRFVDDLSNSTEFHFRKHLTH